MNGQAAWHELAAWASGLPIKLAAALAIAAGGGLLTLTLRLAAALLLRRRMGNARIFVPNLVGLAGWLLTFFAALSVFGVASPIIGAVVTFGVALGAGTDLYFGLRLLLSESPFRIGDAIEVHGESISGLVQQFDLFKTTLWIGEGETLTFQNRKLGDFVVVNRSFDRLNKIKLTVVLQRPLDPAAAEAAIEALLTPAGECRARLDHIDPSSVTFRTAVKAAGASREDTRIQAMQAISEELPKQGFKVLSVAAA